MTIVVPASPGGAIDLAARLIGQKLTESWGQPVTIDNKAGATGIIGTDFVGVKINCHCPRRALAISLGVTGTVQRSPARTLWRATSLPFSKN